MFEEQQYTPISAWGYFWYRVLFSIPLAGLIFAIVFSFSNKNINRRNLARSQFCGLLIAAIFCVITVVLSLFVPAVATFFKDVVSRI